MPKNHLLEDKGTVTIPLDNNNKPYVNWYIMYGWLLSHDDEEVRNDIISYRYNKRLLKKGMMLSNKFSTNYESEYHMLFSFIDGYHSGINYEIEIRKHESLAAGYVIATLYAMTCHNIDEPGLSKARHICLETNKNLLKKWNHSNKNYLTKVIDCKLDVLSYCAAFYTFYNSKTTRSLSSKTGLDLFLTISQLYRKFCLEFTSSRLNSAIDPHTIRPKSSIGISDKYTIKIKNPILQPIYTKEELAIALKNFPRDKRK